MLDAQQRRVGALGAGVAEEVEALHRQVGQQADADGLLDVEVLAEGAADEDLLHVGEVDADAAAEHLEAGVDRRLGADQAADVRLGEDDVVVGAALAGAAHDVLGHAVAHAHAGASAPRGRGAPTCRAGR